VLFRVTVVLVLVGACWIVSVCVVVVVVAVGSSEAQEEKMSAPPAISGSKTMSFFIML